MIAHEGLSATDVFIMGFGAGVLLLGLGVVIFTAFLYVYHWVKGDRDW